MPHALCSTRPTYLYPAPCARACPVRYYLLQSCISGLCTLVLNVLLLLQVGNLLGQFENLEPKWPYLPMIIFQLVCVAVVDVMQVRPEGARATCRTVPCVQSFCPILGPAAAQSNRRFCMAAVRIGICSGQPSHSPERAPARRLPLSTPRPQVKILIRKEDLREKAVRERFAAYQQQVRERADKLTAQGQSSAAGKGHASNQLLPSAAKRSDVAVTVVSEPAVAIGGLRSRGSRDAATNSETEGEGRGGAATAAASAAGGARTMKRTKSETPSDQEDPGAKGGRAAAGGPLGVLAKVWLVPTARLRHALAETADFK